MAYVDGLSDPRSTIQAAFDRRLDPAAQGPVAVALSGGGDSLAALIATLAWARRHGRAVLALCVDHGLQANSADWTAFARDTALALGADARTLAWRDAKPERGVAAAARMARHGLIASAAREAGARVVVMGHTADDLMEGELMRAWGSTLGRPREWSPSPAWPQGREVFILRPLLAQRRAALRAQLTARGARWIKDPANDDPRSPRARARQVLRQASPPPGVGDHWAGEDAAGLARQAAAGDTGTVEIAREALMAASAAGRRRFLAAAAACAGGAVRLPRRASVETLAARIEAGETLIATLAGARIVAGDRVRLFRDAGEASRGGLAPLDLAAGEAGVWDGRYLVTARSAATVRPLAGSMARLDRAQREALRRVPAPARGGLPLIDTGVGPAVCPILAESGAAQVRSLVAGRLLAACAAISKEPAT